MAGHQTWCPLLVDDGVVDVPVWHAVNGDVDVLAVNGQGNLERLLKHKRFGLIGPVREGKLCCAGDG